MGKNVLIFADRREKEIRQVTLEAIAVGKLLAGDGNVVVAVLGSDPEATVNKLAAYGADHVIIVDDPSLDTIAVDAYVHVWKKLIDHVQPNILLTGHTPVGRDVAPRVAMALQLGLVSDCIAVELMDYGTAVFTRPIYAGKAFVTKTVPNGIPFATIRPNNIAPLTIDASRTATVEKVSIPIEQSLIQTIVTNVIKKATSGIDLAEARIVVSGGRGVRSSAGFQPLQELADVLGAAIGASRGACDAGYCDYALQIGQTGKVVTPDLYIACGISGAIQHIAGMSQSKVIVAINTDPDAPIFQIADYGIVGDLFVVVPLLTQALRARLTP
jgi:electron transfer flavoprotein alpha subunit